MFRAPATQLFTANEIRVFKGKLRSLESLMASNSRCAHGDVQGSIGFILSVYQQVIEFGEKQATLEESDHFTKLVKVARDMEEDVVNYVVQDAGHMVKTEDNRLQWSDNRKN